MKVINFSEGISSKTDNLGTCNCDGYMAIAVYDSTTKFTLLCNVADMTSDGIDNIDDILNSIK